MNQTAGAPTVRRAVAALALVALSCAGAGWAADSSRVLVGRSIGDIRLGMSDAAVTAAYGTPARTTRWRLPGRSGPAAIYRAPGGSLLVHLDAGRVVAIETTSPRYRLSGEVGVGTITPRRTDELAFSWRGFRYDACSGTYQRRAYGAVTELVLQFGARTGRRIVAIAMADAAHLLLLPGASRCD